ncbi:MAG: DNA cytosine methyltransferase [Anaeroplasma sp.]|nr:DNA cytosine methyltransferase [Anaeroplasma sp.]
MLLNKDFKFIDLFAGIGGFHCAMDKYSNGRAKCVLASEINEEAKKLYENHFGMEINGDIKEIMPNDIKEYVDVVCGGFPCQTFSRAGMQKGFGDPRGTLFREIIRLIERDKIEEQPRFLILENVRNLITHDDGVTWNTIKKALQDAKYNVIDTPIVVGPKDFDIPQLRDRAIIVAVRKDIYDKPIKFDVPRKKSNSTDIFSIIDKNLTDSEMDQYKISEHDEKVLNCWDEFIKCIKFVPSSVKKNTDNKKEKIYIKKEFKGIIGFPIWAFEFGQDYDINDKALDYQDWKKEFVVKNRLLYEYNKKAIDKWLKKWNNLSEFSHTEQKMEWQIGTNYKSIWDGIIQFRPSGIRVKQPTESPTLVAMVHVPIIGKYKRYITIKEAAKLQSFPNDYDFTNETEFNAYKQLGNAVNVDVIYNVFKLFIEFIEKETSKEEK